MHLRRQFSRLVGSLRRKEAELKNKEKEEEKGINNFQDENQQPGGEGEERARSERGRRRRTRLTFHNLSSSLRLSHRHKENSLSQCQLLQTEDDDDDTTECQQDNDALSLAEHFECQMELTLEEKRGRRRISKITEKVGLGGEMKDNRKTCSTGTAEERRMTTEMKKGGGQMGTCNVEICDQTIDLRHRARCPTPPPFLYNESELDKIYKCPVPFSDTTTTSSTYSEVNKQTIEICSRCNDSPVRKERSKQKVRFKEGVRKSARRVRKAFQDGFVAWGHSMTYASGVMPNMYECPPSASSSIHPQCYGYCEECRSYSKFKNHALQCSHLSHSTQLSYY